MKTQAERITKARTAIILDAPFFGSLLLRLKMVRDDSKETFCTNGVVIKYNEKFCASLSDDELRGVLVHEVAHPALGHLWRMDNRDAKRWNQACDYAINEMMETYAEECKLKQRSVPWKLPAGALLDPSMRGKASEEIYNLLPDPPPDNKNGPGEFEEAREEGEETTTEEEWKIAVTQAAQAAKALGNCPDSIRRLIDEMLTPKVPWREVLREFLRSPARDDYRWSRPNPRYAGTGFILPSLRNERMGRIVIAVDTSGSIRERELAEFQAEVQACLDETTPEAIDVIYCDAEISGREEFLPGDSVRLTPQGGGGTDFTPVFLDVDQADSPPAALVYLTDGIGAFPETVPEYPVLWASTLREDFPFGQVTSLR